MRSKTLLATALSAAACLAAVSPAWAATTTVTVTGTPDQTTVVLDSHDSDDGHFAGPVSAQALTDGKLYVAEVLGTFSYYSKRTWQQPSAPWDGICGTPGSKPQIGSPGLANGPVGMDAETVFARPCSGPAGAKTPKVGHWNNFEISTNTYFFHPTAVGGPFSTPSWSHAYDYVLGGHGKAAQFRLRDLPGTADNYGRLKILVRKATAGDCWSGRYPYFGFASENECANFMWNQNT